MYKYLFDFLLSYGYIPRSGIARLYGSCMFNFLRSCPVVFPSGRTSKAWWFQFLHILTNTCCFLCVCLNYYFYYSHSSKYEVISHCGFDLRFHNDLWCWTSFHLLIGHLCILFVWRMSTQVFCPFLKNGSIADLQYCVSFRCTAKWFSYTYTCIYSFSKSFPI